MTNSDNFTVQYAAFTDSGKCYRQNQDALLLPGAVQQKDGFWRGQLYLDAPLRFAIADGGVGGGCVAAYHWHSLNGRFSKLTSHLLETGVCLFLADWVRSPMTAL
ncbi:MAG: hypothetical protein PHY54_00040 [Methylococcales bacterium]|nr:hypothetical protein [Methylococcales bacterium]